MSDTFADKATDIYDAVPEDGDAFEALLTALGPVAGAFMRRVIDEKLDALRAEIQAAQEARWGNPPIPDELTLVEGVKALVEERENAIKGMAELRLVSAGPSPERDAFVIKMQADIIPLMAEALVGQFKELGGKNYVEYRLASNEPGFGPFVLTMQRLEGFTPHQLQKAAENKLKALAEMVLDVTTEMPPTLVKAAEDALK